MDPGDLSDSDPVVPNPGKIIGIGMNYLAHTAELKRKQPKAPSLFARGFPTASSATIEAIW